MVEEKDTVTGETAHPTTKSSDEHSAGSTRRDSGVTMRRNSDSVTAWKIEQKRKQSLTRETPGTSEKESSSKREAKQGSENQ